MMEVCEVRYEFPDKISTVVMKDSVNNNLDDISRNDLNKINDVGVNEEGRYFFNWKRRCNRQRGYLKWARN